MEVGVRQLPRLSPSLQHYSVVTPVVRRHPACHCLGRPGSSQVASVSSALHYSRRFANHKQVLGVKWNSTFKKKLRHVQVHAQDPLVPLGLDFLTFLSVTVVIVPLFKELKVSPILGFLLSGFLLQQVGGFRDIGEMEKLSELGVLFLLFEMGLELSLDRLKALAKYAFGLGSLQILISTLAFTAFALPVGSSLGTHMLMKLAHAPDSLVSIRSVDEAVVIAGALSMSSSAFVLQLLSERGQSSTRFGSATLGVLLMQDIAVVPFLVLLPLIEGGDAAALGDATPERLVSMLGPTVLQTVGGLGLLLLGGRFVLRQVFEVVAESRSNESFIALCLLTVTGASLLTQKMGFSDTLGAFIAGVLLSETSFRTQVEADIRPFRGLLLGMFFLTTGSSVNISILAQYWQVVLLLLAGLVGTKTIIISALGQSFGLTRGESVRTALLLSQGGEFAFVLLSLANDLQVLPSDLNKVLIIVVVLSMALTPALADLGNKAGDWLDSQEAKKNAPDTTSLTERSNKDESPIVICGFGDQGQMLANMLVSPLASGTGSSVSYVAFDLDPSRVQASREAGFEVIFGDGSRGSVLKAAGVSKPRALVICHSGRSRALQAVQNIRIAFPTTPLYVFAANMRHAAELQEAGADSVIISSNEGALSLGATLLRSIGASDDQVGYLRKGIEQAVVSRTLALAEKLASQPEAETNRPEVFVVDPAHHLSAAMSAAHNSASASPETSSSDEDEAAGVLVKSTTETKA